MAAIRVPMMRLPTQGKKYMPKTTTIDHTSVLEMALVGYEMQRNRIEAAIAEIQVELGQGGPSRYISTATDNSEPKATGKKRFSAAAWKRMAAAQKKRWQVKKATAKKAPAKRTQPTAPAKRQKAVVEASRKKTAAKPKVAVKKAVPKPKAVKRIVKPKVESVAKPPKLVSETPVPNVETETPVAIVTE